ncbi:cysteine desulfurase family protein [Pseudogemmobacter bohemicus]|uniref:cysteine desulfurase family protein n=1 Tax=Pseudogemmobacter bohemicus TaxID=2250708 RepID=UPI000DD35239|nr:aminotransferase class V-fold PLP-dependent enzyme [Pseudogemmobacter bohemicus]
MSARLYLDWNATVPLRDEARAAMTLAMDVIGNPSSVHSEGRAAKALMERAREEISAAFGADGADLVFTSGTTEASALALAGRGLHCGGVEHSAVSAWCHEVLPVSGEGRVTVTDPGQSTLQLANPETGIVQDLPEGLAVSDLTQGMGKLPVAFNWLGCDMGLVSAHKFGGPRGIGALFLKRGLDVEAKLKGGGQEMGRRSGTENLIGIAGMAAAARAAARDLADGTWEEVARIRDILESALFAGTEGIISGGIISPSKGQARLPNTLCIVAPGWKGETQVMAMDLAGFAVSAGSACSSGKVRGSKVLGAMGYGDQAGHMIRISIGPGVSEENVLRFAEAWTRAYGKARARAA